MMTHAEAKVFQAKLTADTRALSKARKADLVTIRRVELEAEGVIWESGGPVSKDELVNDILNRRYPLAEVNEATHVLYHAPSARWEACEHCQAKPSTTSVNTWQLVPGDVVLERGMRIRVDDVRHYHPNGAPTALELWSCPGTVLNAAELLEQHAIPASFLQTYGYTEGAGWTVERRDAWTVYGDAWTVWIVELPRPAGAR